MRSIEEPTTAQLFNNPHNNINSSSNSYINNSSSSNSNNNSNNINSNTGKMPAELGGTGYGSEQNLLLSTRTGVPLAIYQNHHHQQQHNQQQQHHQYQLQHNHHLNHLYQHQNSNSSASSLNPLSSSQHKYDPEYARMESWMDENQEFVQDYFIR